MSLDTTEKLEKLEAAVAAQIQALKNQVAHLPQPEQAYQLLLAVNSAKWVAENHEGRAGAPSVEFTRVQQVAIELREEQDQTGILSFAQLLALDYLTLMLA